MKRRVYIIGMLAVLLTVHVAQTTEACARIVNSAQNFQRYYHDLRRGDTSLNPVEVLIFSLVLANSKSPEPAATGVELPVSRT